jgi:hypothetical protein
LEGKLYKLLGVSAVAIVLAAMSYGAGTAAEKEKKKAETPPACKSLKVEADCKAREDCSWVAASIDKKTGKEKRRAYCRSKPKSKKKT